MPLSWRSAAAIAVLAALVLASMQPSAAAPPATRRPNPLERFRSWDEAWAALSPYARSSPKNAFCGSGPTVAAACGVSTTVQDAPTWARSCKFGAGACAAACCAAYCTAETRYLCRSRPF